MLESGDLRFFAIVAASPSLAAAARSLDITPSAVTQRLAALEGRLRLRLVERSTRGLHLTEEGRFLAQRSRSVLGEMDALADEVGRRSATVGGRLRVAAAYGFGRAYVAPAMAATRRSHPAIDLTLWLLDDPVHSLDIDAWDVLIHVGPLKRPAMTMRRLAPNRRILCAAPDYLARAPALAHPGDLAAHNCGVIREDRDDTSIWTFTRADGERQTVRVPPSFVSNDGEVAREWAKAGLGVVARSEWDVAADLTAGTLREVLPDWRLPDADVVALFGARTGRLARTTAFVSLLAGMLKPPPWRARHRPAESRQAD